MQYLDQAESWEAIDIESPKLHWAIDQRLDKLVVAT